MKGDAGKTGAVRSELVKSESLEPKVTAEVRKPEATKKEVATPEAAKSGAAKQRMRFPGRMSLQLLESAPAAGAHEMAKKRKAQDPWDFQLCWKGQTKKQKRRHSALNTKGGRPDGWLMYEV